MYIYNIGRCYQDMGAPDKALASFHEYLRKEKHVTPALKQEIDGHIKEMEDLKKQQQALTEKLGAVAAPVAAPAAEAPPAAPAAKPGATPEPATAVPDEPKTPAAKEAKREPENPVAAYLAKLHAQHETVWRARAKKPDDAKAQKIETLLTSVPADDPRIAKYELYVADLYAGKHFFLRLQELEKDSQAQVGSGDGQQVGAGPVPSAPRSTPVSSRPPSTTPWLLKSLASRRATSCSWAWAFCSRRTVWKPGLVRFSIGW